jgi:hypothetical protein
MSECGSAGKLRAYGDRLRLLESQILVPDALSPEPSCAEDATRIATPPEPASPVTAEQPAH